MTNFLEIHLLHARSTMLPITLTVNVQLMRRSFAGVLLNEEITIYEKGYHMTLCRNLFVDLSNLRSTTFPSPCLPKRLLVSFVSSSKHLASRPSKALSLIAFPGCRSFRATVCHFVIDISVPFPLPLKATFKC